MKRFFSVLLFLLLAALVFGIILDYAKEKASVPETVSEKKAGIVVYTDLPMDVLSEVGKKFYEETGIHTDIILMSSMELLASPKEGAEPDLYLTAQDNLDRLKSKNKLIPYSSPHTDVTLNLFKDGGGCWNGLWLDPFVFVASQDFSGKYPLFNYNWNDVLIVPTIRISFTDFLTQDMAADFLMSLIEHFGQKEAFFLLSVAQSHIMQYGKYLSTPARLAGMGKCDIGISNYNEAIRTQKENLPVVIFYPTDGTAWYLYGVGLASKGKNQNQAKEMIDWLSKPEKYKDLMEKNNYHYIYINDGDKKSDKNGTDLNYWGVQKNYTDKGRKEILNYWMENIRFGRNQ